MDIDHYLFPTGIEEIFQLDNIAMFQASHYLQFPVLEARKSKGTIQSSLFIYNLL